MNANVSTIAATNTICQNNRVLFVLFHFVFQFALLPILLLYDKTALWSMLCAVVQKKLFPFFVIISKNFCIFDIFFAVYWFYCMG